MPPQLFPEYHLPSSPDLDSEDDYTPSSMSPNTRPTRSRKRSVAQISISTSSPEDSAGPSNAKRRRSTQSQAQPRSQSQSGSSRVAPIEIEDIDAVDDDDEENDEGKALRDTLQKQREEQIRAQKAESDKPVMLNTLTCNICLDTPTDLTATSCGHLFCHGCLNMALKAGEARRRPGEAKRSQCPCCRKNLDRNKASDVIPLLIKKGLQTQPRKKAAA